MRNKNKTLLEIYKAQKKVRKMKAEHPEMEEDEIAEKIMEEMYGPMGVSLFKEVKKDPKKYKKFLKGVHSDL